MLFNIFVFDLPFCVQSSLRQYADDTVLYRPIRSDSDTVILQSDLNNIINWCNINRMSLNPMKCKLMTITRSRHPPSPIYNIGSDSLEVVSYYKYLGVIISRDFSWKNHIDSVTSKATKLCGFIRRVVKSNNSTVLVKLYTSLCRPVMEYAAPVWCPSLHTHQLLIEKVQRRFTRSCLGLPKRARPNNTRCKKLGIPLLINRLHFLSISFVVKCLYNKIDASIHSFVTINSRHCDSVKFLHKGGPH